MWNMLICTVGKSLSHSVDDCSTETRSRSAYSSRASILSIFRLSERHTVDVGVTDHYLADGPRCVVSPDCSVGVDMTVINAYDEQFSSRFTEDSTVSEITTVDQTCAESKGVQPPTLTTLVKSSSESGPISGTRSGLNGSADRQVDSVLSGESPLEQHWRNDRISERVLENNPLHRK
jgi:hypothetical protein